MSNEPLDEMHEQRSVATSPPKATSEFSIWWPQTKQGSDLWKLLLGVIVAIGALRQYLSTRYFVWGRDFLPMLFSAVFAGVGWYIILVVVRYLAYWFSDARKR